MRISERAIELPRLVVLASLILCGLGFAAAFTLPKERTPRVKLPVILVAVANPGAPPPTNEKQIVEKIEDEVETSLDHLRKNGSVISHSVNGAAVMGFVFDHNIEVTEAKRDVESLVNRIKGQFPPDAQQDPGPIVRDVAFEDWPIIQVVIAGGQDGGHRRRVAEYLSSLIEKASGVASVDVFGGLEREVQIELNPNLMTLYGFNYQQVESAIRRANMEAPSGSISSSGGDEQRVRTRAKLESIEAIGEVPLGTLDGKLIHLGDIAHVYMGSKPVKNLARYGGRDSAVLLVRPKTDIDVLATANNIQTLVDRFVTEGGGGEGTQINTVRSQAREIGWMLNLLITSAIYGLILVILILWIALGWRNATLISIAVPMSILGTAAIMWFTKRTITPDLAINNMSLFGMILVVGMVVDGCIIVGENIYRHRELGRSPVDAAKRGIAEVGGSLVSAYLTTFAAFGPMFLVRGVMGDFMGQLPVVVLFALCSAMLVDHFLLPVLSVYFMKVRRSTTTPNDSRLTDDPDITPDQIEIAAAEAVVSRSRVKQQYGRMLRYALNHRLQVLAMSIVIVAMPVVLFATGAVGVEFFPDSDMSIIEVHFELPLGSSMENRTAKVAAQIEQAVMRAVRPEEWHQPSESSPRVKPVTTIGDTGALSIRMDDEHGSGPEFGMVYVELALAEFRERTADEIRQAIKDELPPLPGVIVKVRSPKDGPPVGAPVLVRILGRADSSVTLEELVDKAKQAETIIESIPGTFEVSSDYRVRPEISVTPNRAVASLFNVDTAQIATSVNYALEGVRVGEVDFGGSEQIDLRLRNSPGDRDQLDDLASLPLRGSTGKIVRLDQVAQVARVSSANVIRHYDRQRVIGVRAQLREGVLVDDVKAALVKALRPDLNNAQQRTLVRDRQNHILFADERLTIDFGGETEFRDEALSDLNIALLVAVAAMLIILTIKFNSFVQPLIVLFSVPLSLVGVAFGLMICGFYFSVSAMIGVVALAGIVVNDAIVLVDFINRMRDSGVPMKEAVVYAGQLRLRPIILTTITTIGGLLPLGLNIATGGEFFQPLTVTIMFGLGFATMLQLFIIPLMCYTFDVRSSFLDPMRRDDLSGSDKPAPPQSPPDPPAHESTPEPEPAVAALP